MHLRSVVWNVFFSVMLLCAGLPAIVSIGNWLEPRIFTVVSLASFDAVDGGYEVHFEKYRPCKFIGVFWLTETNSVRQRFDAEYTRPTGPGGVDVWVVPCEVDITRHRAVAHHRCHPLWITETPFYEPE